MILGRYEIVRELGKGAMGVVYLAKDPLIGRLVALKTIRIIGADDDEAREYQQRFVREAQAAGILSHPAIVTVHDIGQDAESGTSFIAMEYVEGPTLKEIVQSGNGLPYEKLADVVAQVAEALDFAHARGIIHRDVKPANILICDDRAKITDFGIAKIASAASNLTTTGQFIGTPNYMAPEQVKGGVVDGRSDIFSLGICLYEALTRRKPFGGDSLTTISYKIVHEAYTPVRDIEPKIPEGFEEVVQRCLAKNPEDRFQRGRDVANALRNIFRPVDTMPRRKDPLLSENTVLNRQVRVDTPTVEIPFPEAEEPYSVDSEGPLADPDATPPPVEKTAPRPRPSRSFDAKSLLKTRVPAPLFFGVIILALLLLGVKCLSIKRQEVSVPPVDVAREQLVAKQRVLRVTGSEQLRRQNVEAAYATFSELKKIAPKSPWVNFVVGKLDQIRSEELVSRQKVIESQLKLEQGRALFDRKDFQGAIPLFEEAFYLNPRSTEALNYLKMSREQLALKQVRQGTTPSAPPRALPTPRRSAQINEVTQQLNAAPSGLTVIVDSPVADGHVTVKVGGSTIVNEQLFEERKGLIRRKVPRKVNAYQQITPTSAEVQVLLSIPSLGINDNRVYRQTFRSGVAHQLVITVSPQTRSATIDLR